MARGPPGDEMAPAALYLGALTGWWLSRSCAAPCGGGLSLRGAGPKASSSIWAKCAGRSVQRADHVGHPAQTQGGAPAARAGESRGEQTMADQVQDLDKPDGTWPAGRRLPRASWWYRATGPGGWEMDGEDEDHAAVHAASLLPHTYRFTEHARGAAHTPRTLTTSLLEVVASTMGGEDLWSLPPLPVLPPNPMDHDRCVAWQTHASNDFVCTRAHALRRLTGAAAKRPDPRARYLAVNAVGKSWAFAQVMAHRLVLYAMMGPPPRNAWDKYVCMHACDNKACLHPGHLYWGTVQQNKQMADWVKAGKTEEVAKLVRGMMETRRLIVEGRMPREPQ